MVKKKKRKKSGLPPGSLIFTGEQKVDRADISILQYNGAQIQEREPIGEEPVLPVEDMLTWYDVRGLHETALVEKIGRTLEIHPLVLEDVLDIHQRPKFDEYPNGFYLVVRALQFDPETFSLSSEQVSIYVGKDFVLSFQENETDLFTAVRERLLSGRGKIRIRSGDYLAYALIDNIVDHYYLIMDEIEDVVEQLESEILENTDSNIKGRIHRLKREMIGLRKSVAPLREAINRFARAEHEYIREDSVIFLRDLYDHTIQVMDMIESNRDTLTGLQDLFLSELSFRMNNVMQVLTIIATIFIPLTFMAGIYGMNFEYMPELSWRYSYFVLWIIMIGIALGLLYYFRRKRWL